MAVLCGMPTIQYSALVANTVANVIAALLMHQLPTMLVQFMTQFSVNLLNDLSFSSPIDVIRPRPLKPLA